MNSPQKTSKKAGIVLISNIITATNQAIILIVLARIVSKDILGDVLKLIMIYKTAVLLGNFGFNDNPYYFLPKLKPTAWGSFLFQCMKILFLSGLVSGTISLLFFWYFFNNVWIGLFFIPIIALELTTSLIPDYLVAAGRVKASSLFNISLSVFNVAMIWLVCFYFDDKIRYLSYGFMTYNLVRIIFTAIIIGKSLRFDREPLPDNLLREQMGFGIPLGLSSLTLRLNKQMDNYIVAFFFPSTVFAEYSVGSWEIPMLLKIPYSITAVYLPRYTRLFDERKIEELHQKWLQVGEKIIFLIVPITSFFLIFANELIHTVFGDQFQEAVVVFQIYTLTLYTRISSYSGLLKSFGETRFILGQSMLLIFLNFVFNVIGVNTIGLYGAPTGTLLANIIMLMLSLRRISSILRVPVSRLLPYRYHFHTTLTSIITAVLLKFALTSILTSDVTVLLAGAILFIPLFLSVASMLKIMKTEDWFFLLEFVGIRKKNLD